MREQLRHLLAMAERPNVEVLVLPFMAGAHASTSGTSPPEHSSRAGGIRRDDLGDDGEFDFFAG